jgi:DHA1 family inner membrane transport protein
VTDARRAPLVLLSACVFFAVCTEMLPVGLLPEIGRGLGVSSSAAGILVSLYAVLVAITSVPIAAIAERWPRRVVLAVLLGAYTLSNVVLAAVLGGLAVAVVRVLPAQEPPRTASQTTSRTPVLAGVRRPAVLAMATVITLLALGHFTLYTYISPLLLHDGVPRADVGAVLFGYGCGGLLGLAVAGAVVARRPDEALAADMVLMGVSLVLAATVASTIGIIAVVAVWGVAFGAFPTLTQTVMLRSAGDATDAATALVNATTNMGIAGGALLGSRLLGVVDVPRLGWVGAGLVAASLVVYAARLKRSG